MLDFHTLDVFTSTRFKGNPLAVVLGADGLSTKQMQIMAREFNLSETIFVRKPADAAHSAEVRIFFPTAEIPFAGHPTVGCAILLAEMDHGLGDWQCEITLEEQAGLVPVNVSRKNGITHAEFTAPVIPHAPKHPCAGVEELTMLAAPSLGLDPTQIGMKRHHPNVWSGGPSFAYVPVRDLNALAQTRPTEPHWSKLMQAAGVDSAYVYTSLGPNRYQARMFSPTAGIPEDPATGSASAILAAQLLASGDLLDGDNQIDLQQGVEMGRASDIAMRVDLQNGAIAKVKIAGNAVRLSHGCVNTPD